MRPKTGTLLAVVMILSGGAIGYSQLMARQDAAQPSGSDAAVPIEKSNASKEIDAQEEFSRATSRGVQQRLHQLMNSAMLPVTLDFGPEASLREILDQLEAAIKESSEQRVRFLLDESDPDIGDPADYLSVTTVSGVSIPKDSMTLASVLELIFSKVKDQELTWAVKNEVILITTMNSADNADYAFVRSYDISRMRKVFEEYAESDVHVAFGGGGKGGLGVATYKGTWKSWLYEQIRNLTGNSNWIESGGEVGSMCVVGNRLIVRQTRIGHEQVVEVLEELEQALPEQ